MGNREGNRDTRGAGIFFATMMVGGVAAGCMPQPTEQSSAIETLKAGLPLIQSYNPESVKAMKASDTKDAMMKNLDVTQKYAKEMYGQNNILGDPEVASLFVGQEPILFLFSNIKNKENP